MIFKKYIHLENFGNTEVENIEIGKCYIFPKIDGTNSSVWLDNNEIQAGSRKRHLTLEDDNAGFLNWVSKQENIKNYLKENPNHRLFGEWLVPHSLQTYRKNAWKNFYVFDVSDESNNTMKFLSYDAYKPLLEKHNIEYIPPICIITNPSYDQFITQLTKNNFLIEDGKGYGEGIVIKNYEFKNQVWAKIVSSEFKEKHFRVMGAPEMKGKKIIEEEIVEHFVTTAICEKVYHKIRNEDGWSNKMIPRLLNNVYYDLIKEESWEIVKKYKNPVIDYSLLNMLTIRKTKEILSYLF